MIEGIVAIIGRPNVGKSTLFNRLTETNVALIDDRPGVTRDRLYGVVPARYDEDPGYIVIDTGGFETKDLYFQPFTQNIVWEQTEIAINEADVVLMVFDAKSGLHPHDRELVNYLKKKNKKVIYLANKVDGVEKASDTWDFFELGVDEILKISAAHNRGIWDLREKIEDELAQSERHARKVNEEGAIKIALVGRPNAGKSSILNRMVGENRSLVSDVAGTTRDAIDTPITYNKKPYVLIDTAGIRRKTKITDKIESLSVMRSLMTIERADIVALVITADEGITDQEARLASLAVENHKPLLFIVNKWDLIPNKDTHTIREFEEAIYYKLRDMSFVPMIFVSCLENQRVHKIMAMVERLAEAYQKRVSTARLNEVLHAAVQQHTPALLGRTNKRVKFYYATQVRSAPPTIVIKCNVADEIQESYKRYLVNRFRKDLGFDEIPLHLIFRGKDKEKAQEDEGASSSRRSHGRGETITLT